MNILIIGTGNVATANYLPVLCKHDDTNLSYFNRTRSKAEECASRFGGSVCGTLEEAFALDLDAVFVLTKETTRAEVLRSLLQHRPTRVFLEKPLAHTPDVATEIYNELIRSRKVFRLGYTFRYTPWGKELLNTFITAKKASGSFFIHWSFYAHHYRYEMYKWKRFHNQGGGAIRFYGIQIIALLAEIGYLDVKISRSFGVNLNESEKWVAVVSGLGLPDCKIVVDTKSSVNKFQIGLNIYSSKELPMKYSVNLSDPFALAVMLIG